jgi:hypothetical protein
MTGRKVLLLLDGFSSHRAGVDLLEAQDIELTNFKVEFLPANTTSVCQPLDQASSGPSKHIAKSVGCNNSLTIMRQVKILIKR